MNVFSWIFESQRGSTNRDQAVNSSNSLLYPVREFGTVFLCEKIHKLNGVEFGTLKSAIINI